MRSFSFVPPRAVYLLAGVLLVGVSGCRTVESLFQGDECKNPLPYRSSIQLASRTDDGDDSRSNAELQKMARISADDARAAAVASVPGSVEDVELENECGNLIYEVEVKTGRKEREVIVDAGDGQVLHVDGEADS